MVLTYTIAIVTILLWSHFYKVRQQLMDDIMTQKWEFHHWKFPCLAN